MRHRRLWLVLAVGVLAAGLLPPPSVADEMPSWDGLRVDAGRIEQRILDLARFGRNPQGGVSRVAFSAADIEGRRYVVSLMEHAGLEVRIDEAGNILGRRAGTDEDLPPILFGSHIDSVPEGGIYDGDVGVIAATAAPTDARIRQLVEDSARDLGLSYIHMPSGAGHDAQEIARIAPVGMILVRSVDGISHSPGELTRPADMANGANVLLQTILRIDRAGLGVALP